MYSTMCNIALTEAGFKREFLNFLLNSPRRPQSRQWLSARVGEEVLRKRQGGVDQPGADRPVRDVVQPDHILRSEAHILEDEQQVAAIRAELWVAVAAGAFDRVGLEPAVQVGAVAPQVAEAVVALVAG